MVKTAGGMEWSSKLLEKVDERTDERLGKVTS